MVERLWRTVKYEDIYLRDYGGVSDARAGLSGYLRTIPVALTASPTGVPRFRLPAGALQSPGQACGDRFAGESVRAVCRTESGGDFIEKLRAFVAANPDKQVLYIGGDTHTPRVDHPLTDIYPSPTQLTPAGTAYPNFTRLEVYAQTAAFGNWFKVTVNPDGTLSTQTQIVPSE